MIYIFNRKGTFSFSDEDVEYLVCGLQTLFIVIVVDMVIMVFIVVVNSEILNVGKQSE
jgi:hypothetical protein